MTQKILICGTHSFVATGFYEKLLDANFQVECFSRGKVEMNGAQVTGHVNEISSNPFLASEYDVVVNFIVLHGRSIEENLEYVKDLIELCRKKSVKRLIHISSIIVYKNNEDAVDEMTEIERNSSKSGYGALKIEVDRYLQYLEEPRFSIIYVRPGFVLAREAPVPFVKRLPLGFALLKGGKKSIKPLLQRDDLQTGLIKIIENDFDQSVYLFVPDTNITILDHAKKLNYRRCLLMPKWLILGTARLFVSLGLMSRAFFVRIEGMYIETHYDSSLTQRLLKVNF